jgi:ATP-dependent Clp protease ATP-binding subunit ClpA
MRTIDTSKISPKVETLKAKFASLIVGQEEATSAIASCLEKFLSGMNDPTRPIASLLFLGATGTGKTSVVEAFAEGITGKSTNMIKIDCAEFQMEHEIAKLIGSPAGYLGHRETPARFKNETIKALQSFDVPFTIILLDEIEKASDSMWNLLLGILDRGTLTLGDNSVTDFTKTIIIMTSNVGSRKIAENGGLGFLPENTDTQDEKDIQASAKSAARAKFSPEFLNRLDEIVVFHTLSKDQIEEIMGMELKKIQIRVMSTSGNMLSMSPAALNEVLLRGYDKKYNARGIRRAMEKEIMAPLARACSSGEIGHGENIVADFMDGAFRFYSIKQEGAACGA